MTYVYTVYLHVYVCAYVCMYVYVCICICTGGIYAVYVHYVHTYMQ